MDGPKEAELAAFKIILSNVVARLAVTTSNSRQEVQATLEQMRAECRSAANRSALHRGGAFASDTLTSIDEFFGNITIT